MRDAPKLSRREHTLPLTTGETKGPPNKDGGRDRGKSSLTTTTEEGGKERRIFPVAAPSFCGGSFPFLHLTALSFGCIAHLFGHLL
jgi:hypothetical protein